MSSQHDIPDYWDMFKTVVCQDPSVDKSPTAKRFWEIFKKSVENYTMGPYEEVIKRVETNKYTLSLPDEEEKYEITFFISADTRYTTTITVTGIKKEK